MNMNAESVSSTPVVLYEAVLGQVLKRLREHRGLNQAQMARELEITQSYWSKIEQGAVDVPTSLLRASCSALGVTQSQLLSQVDEVCRQAEERGVKILDRGETKKTSDWLPLLGMAAVARLIGLALSKK